MFNDVRATSRAEDTDGKFPTFEGDIDAAEADLDADVCVDLLA